MLESIRDAMVERAKALGGCPAVAAIVGEFLVMADFDGDNYEITFYKRTLKAARRRFDKALRVAERSGESLSDALADVFP